MADRGGEEKEGEGESGQIDLQQILAEMAKFQSEIVLELEEDGRILKLTKTMVNAKVHDIVTRANRIVVECARLQGISDSADRFLGTMSKSVKTLKEQQKSTIKTNGSTKEYRGIDQGAAKRILCTKGKKRKARKNPKY